MAGVMRGKFLHHVTLTTGHTRRSYRDEVSEDAISWARDSWKHHDSSRQAPGSRSYDARLLISAEQLNSKSLPLLIEVVTA